MSWIYHRRWRRYCVASASALLLAAFAPIGVAAAQNEASEQKQKLENLRDVNADARRDADELRGQMAELQAEATDRGLLLTLDDSLFATNAATFSSSGHRQLNALADFLKQHPERTVAVDGYAGAGLFRYDQALSKRRADAVRTDLIRQGIAPSRLTARGNGEAPHDDGPATGQRSNRRVEVIIVDPMISVPQLDVTASGT